VNINGLLSSRLTLRELAPWAPVASAGAPSASAAAWAPVASAGAPWGVAGPVAWLRAAGGWLRQWAVGYVSRRCGPAVALASRMAFWEFVRPLPLRARSVG